MDSMDTGKREDISSGKLLPGCHREVTSESSSEYREKTVKLLTIVCIVSCTISITCLLCLLTFVYKHSNLCQQALAQHQRYDNRLTHVYDEHGVTDTVGQDDLLNIIDATLYRHAREAKVKTKSKTRSSKSKKKRRKCKCKRGKQGVAGLPGKQGSPGEPADNLKSAHYASHFKEHEIRVFPTETGMNEDPDGIRQSWPKLAGSYDRCITLAPHTLVCRNRTIILPKQTNFKFLHPASWVDEESGPLKMNLASGVFTVQYSGIYLIYSTTNFYDAKSKMYQVIKVNGDDRSWCLDGIDHVEKQPYKDNVRHRTCSTTGVMKLNKGDKIELQTLNPNLSIDITKDRTYFGVILLHSPDTKSSS